MTKVHRIISEKLIADQPNWIITLNNADMRELRKVIRVAKKAVKYSVHKHGWRTVTAINKICPDNPIPIKHNVGVRKRIEDEPAYSGAFETMPWKEYNALGRVLERDYIMRGIGRGKEK